MRCSCYRFALELKKFEKKSEFGFPSSDFLVSVLLLNLDYPAFWGFFCSHLDSCECVAEFLEDWTAFVHSTWNHDGLLVVVNLSDWGDDSSSTAETDLDEISKLVLVHLALFDFHSEVVFRHEEERAAGD